MAVRVLVVDDSTFMRSFLIKYIDADPRLEVVGTAANGLEAIERVQTLRPDVVSLDIEMPKMNGLEALRTIMRVRPVPVIMLSSLTSNGATETMESLQIGAIDFVHKPTSTFALNIHRIMSELNDKLYAAAAVKLKPPVRLRERPAGSVRSGVAEADWGSEVRQIVAIGTSTGGPQALTSLLSGLEEGWPCPVLIVQHMPALFTTSLAARLHKLSPMPVAEAVDGEPLRNGRVYLAPGDHHMTVQREGDGYRIGLSQGAERSGHRPSVDELFASLTPLEELSRHLVLLTGMGKDGVEEMVRARRSAKVTTVAEARESCVIYGMPRAAVEAGGAEHVVPLDGMVAFLTGCLNRS
ncbi:chemotaxis response regulator protein-glutamate methylesterase [Paenibacillus sp. 598K]|uniref:protein-glutamate methylesterase/protein-glutamine glutaminase n=1 Tax=Paenibacillus sp. 598K TaxID=1117987 RepID=UPI000FF99DA3|nr:chemotaxis response regulator protein-glutamate methylesterase [Paenibacillus sp. 598K]GBF77298.1 chemotaxis response regulator protein-glutamate methylesterase [Paenibacillus sp. 598K]